MKTDEILSRLAVLVFGPKEMSEDQNAIHTFLEDWPWLLIWLVLVVWVPWLKEMSVLASLEDHSQCNMVAFYSHFELVRVMGGLYLGILVFLLLGGFLIRRLKKWGGIETGSRHPGTTWED